MKITWFQDEEKGSIVTLYPSNITLNKVASKYFESAYRVMLGYAKDSKQVFIKPLSKEISVRGDIPQSQMYNITIKSSYGRITNKSFIEEIVSLGELHLEHGPKKFKGEWDMDEHVMSFSLQEVIK